MEELYTQHLLDHNAYPRNKRRLTSAERRSFYLGEARNSICGDWAILEVAFGDEGGVLAAVFQGDGCAVSQAGMSMLTEKLKGADFSYLISLMPEDIYAMLGVTMSPARANCALLCYEALRNALQSASKK